MLKKTLSGVTAGLLISIGGAVFLSAENKVVGAVAFTIGLLSICYYGLSLYTGKVGYLFEKHDKEALSVLFLGLLGNLIGSVCSGLLVQICRGGYEVWMFSSMALRPFADDSDQHYIDGSLRLLQALRA